MSNAQGGGWDFLCANGRSCPGGRRQESNETQFQAEGITRCGHVERKGQDTASISLSSQRPKATFRCQVKM